MVDEINIAILHLEKSLELQFGRADAVAFLHPCFWSREKMISFYVSYSLLNCISYLNAPGHLCYLLSSRHPRKTGKQIPNKKNDEKRPSQTVPHKIAHVFPLKRISKISPLACKCIHWLQGIKTRRPHSQPPPPSHLPILRGSCQAGQTKETLQGRELWIFF